MALIEQQNISLEKIASHNNATVNENNFHLLKYSLVGIVFGIVFVKAEIISWFRIQEMFTLQNFHMYGVIGTAVIVGAISVALIKKFKIKKSLYFVSIKLNLSN